MLFLFLVSPFVVGCVGGGVFCVLVFVFLSEEGLLNGLGGGGRFL